MTEYTEHTSDGLRIHSRPDGSRFVIEGDGTVRHIATSRPNWDDGPTQKDEQGSPYRATPRLSSKRRYLPGR
ncbi:hypothetical protein KBI23_03885 [bacterium]|nr:hypothetical protein [bacterium]MBP9809989.1 hypothetical protein [bacterium]